MTCFGQKNVVYQVQPGPQRPWVFPLALTPLPSPGAHAQASLQDDRRHGGAAALAWLPYSQNIAPVVLLAHVSGPSQDQQSCLHDIQLTPDARKL